MVGLDASLFEYCPQCSFRQIPGMIRDGCITIHLNVEPDLMTAGGLPDDLSIAKTRKPAHQSARTMV